MKKFLLGLLCGVSIPIAAIYCFFVFGGMPVATEGPPLPLERFFVKKALRAAMQAEVGKKAPFTLDDPNLLSGAKNYRNQCAGCHGLPNQLAPQFASTMFPKAPQLFSERGSVTDDPEGETYWKIKNGIRLTGMPAFGKILNDTEIWQLSLLLAHADGLPATVKASLSSR